MHKKDLKEFRYPPEAVNLNKLKDADAFWGWSVQDAAQAAGLNEFPGKIKSMSDVILWINHAAYAWGRMHKESKLGESKMDIRKAIRKMVREELNETIMKYKKAKVSQQPVGKEAPKPKVDRDMTVEDEVKINTQPMAQDKRMEKDKKSGVPTEKEWERFRKAEEVKSVPTIDEINKTWHDLMEKIENDIETICETAQKIGDKTLCNLLGELKRTHKYNVRENRERYKFIKLQYAMRPLMTRLKSIHDFGDKDNDPNIEKLQKLLEKYLRVEVKKKYDTETEKSEAHEKEFVKELK